MGTIVNMEYELDLRTLTITDGGNIPAGQELEAAHMELQKRVQAVISRGLPLLSAPHSNYGEIEF